MMNQQHSPLELTIMLLAELVLLDPADTNWAAGGGDGSACDTVLQLNDDASLEVVTPATVVAKYERPIAEGSQCDKGDREFTCRYQ